MNATIKLDGTTVVITTHDGTTIPIDHDGSAAYHGLVAAARKADGHEPRRAAERRKTYDDVPQPTEGDLIDKAADLLDAYQTNRNGTREMADSIFGVLRNMSRPRGGRQDR